MSYETFPKEGWEQTLAIATPFQETLGTHDDFYVRVMAARYGSMLRDIGALGAGENASSVTISEWDKANLGLLTYGVSVNDRTIAHGAFELLRKPTSKWQAATWVVRQSENGGMVYSWETELGRAQQEAQSDSKEQYGIASAKLESALWRRLHDRRSGAANEAVSHALEDVKSALRDPLAFPENSVLDPHKMRLETALRCLQYGHRKLAKEIVNSLPDVSPVDVEAFWQEYSNYRSTEADLLGVPQGVAAKAAAAFSLSLRRRTSKPSGLVRGLRRPVSSFEWQYNAAQELANLKREGWGAVLGGVADSTEIVDLYIRAHDLEGAQDLVERTYTEIYQTDRGDRLATAALLACTNLRSDSEVVQAGIYGDIESATRGLLDKYSSDMSEAEHNAQAAQYEGYIFAAAKRAEKIGDIALRAQTWGQLISLGEDIGIDEATLRARFGLDYAHQSQLTSDQYVPFRKLMRTWFSMVPHDPFMKDMLSVPDTVMQDLCETRIYVRSGRQTLGEALEKGNEWPSLL